MSSGTPPGKADEECRAPTTFVRKYTPRAQRKPPGGSRAGRRARETGGVGKPARFCQEETHVLAEQFGATEHDGFLGPYLSGNTPEAAFHGQAGRPYSRTCCTARPSAPARLPCPGRRTTAARSARGAPLESPVVGLDIGLLLDSRGATRSSGAVPGASRARLFGVEIDNPPRGVPCSVFPRECCRYPCVADAPSAPASLTSPSQDPYSPAKAGVQI